MRLILSITFITIFTTLQGQIINDRLFIEYKDVINEIKSSNSFNELEFKYEYDFILLLDSSEILLIEKVNQADIKQFRNFSPGLVCNDNTIGFRTEKEDIKDVFLSDNLKTRIIGCTNTYKSSDIKYEKIDFPIYIKGNLAIFSISGPTWTETYFAKLKDNTIQINGLYDIIE